jgi:hypothetical protein
MVRTQPLSFPPSSSHGLTVGSKRSCHSCEGVFFRMITFQKASAIVFDLSGIDDTNVMACLVEEASQVLTIASRGFHDAVNLLGVIRDAKKA